VELSHVVQIMGDAIAEADPAVLPRRLCAAFSQALEGRGAALALMADPTHHHTLAGSDPDAAALGELEFTLGEGPGLEAVARGQAVLVGDLTGPEAVRWPVWSATVAERGLPARAVFAFPLRVGGTGFGLVELYRDRPGVLDEIGAGAARLAADLTALALARSFEEPEGGLGGPVWAADPDVDGVQVDQAIGMVMAQLRVPADTALSALRARAFAEGRPLSAVARDVLARTILFESGGPWQG
jgi:hypothetical protein